VLAQEAELSAMIPSVMQALADEVAKDANRGAPLLMQDYSVDLASGIGGTVD
jgi:hypothetical protein